MKIAFCLYGLSGSPSESPTVPSTSSDEMLNIAEKSYESYNKNIFNNNKEHDFDVYFHTYNHKNINKIIEMYKPKKYIVEEKFEYDFNNGKPIKFIDFMNTGATLDYLPHSSQTLIIAGMSRWHSTYKVLNLIDDKIEYDYIFLCRFDLTFFNPIIFNDLKLKDNDIITPFSIKSEYKKLRKQNPDVPSTFLKLNENEFPWSDDNLTPDYFYIFKNKGIELFKKLSGFGKLCNSAYSIICRIQGERFVPHFITYHKYNKVQKFKVFKDYMKTREVIYDTW